MRIAIIGSDPAALFAAHAAVAWGNDVRIFPSHKELLKGTQFLSMPVPGLSGDPFLLEYHVEGDLDDYRAKISTGIFDLMASLETLDDKIKVWDTRQTYDRAWLELSPLMELHPADSAMRIAREWGADRIIISTPLDELCENDDHEFLYHDTWATPFVKRFGRFESEDVDNLVVCSGFEDDWWFRQSKINGYECTEFSDGDKRPPIADLIEVPLTANCNCLADKSIMLVGAWAKWDRNIRPESAFYEVEDFFKRQHVLEHL